jgi:hypothetical protein
MIAMKLYDYFEQHKGTGVLATAGKDGKVNAALYARPHFMSEHEIVFLMDERLTHKNLKTNPHAVYLFVEAGSVNKGKRLYLTKKHEEEEPEFVDGLRRRRCGSCEEANYKAKYVAYFHIDKEVPLVIA